MRTMSLRALLCLFWFYAATALASSAPLKVAISTKHPSINETIQLTIFLNQESPETGPNLEPLERDFHLLGHGQSFQATLVGRQITAQTKLMLSLKAKRVGKVVIPAIHWGAYHTAPITLHVENVLGQTQVATKDHPAPKAVHDDDIFILVDALPSAPFENSQIIYTVKLYTSQPLTDATLEDPAHVKFSRFPKSKENRYQVLHNDRIYQVIERRYALFPQAAGNYTVKGPSLDGSVLGHNFAALLHQGNQVSRHGKDTLFKVKQKPNEIAAEDWIPAKSLSVEDSWHDKEILLAKGKPLTRIITINAKGVPDTQIPNLTFANIEGMKLYPEKPKSDSYFDGHNVHTVIEQRITYIPSVEASFSIPAIKMPWFNTQTQKVQLAQTNAHTIKTSIDAVPYEPKRGADVMQKPVASAVQPSDSEQGNTPPWLATLRLMLIALCVSAAAYMLFVWLCGQRFARERVEMFRIKRAIRANDVEALDHHFVNWLSLYSLAAKQAHQSPIDDIKSALSEQRYSPNITMHTTEGYLLQVMALRKALRSYRKPKAPKNKTELPKLYPN